MTINCSILLFCQISRISNLRQLKLALVSFLLLSINTVIAESPPADTGEKSLSNSTQQVIFINRGTDQAPVFDVQNDSYGPIEFELLADEIINMRSQPALPIHKLIPARTTVHLARFTQEQPNQAWSYTYTTRYVVGDPAAKHLTGKPYRLPFDNLKTFTVSQGFDGSHSHQHSKTKYAIDILMPEDSRVFAARTGTVIEIVTEKLDDTTAKNVFPVYQLRMLHQDGTMAVYAYLKPGSLSVSPGQHVQRGQLIGLSGTSLAEDTKPHLHFAIQKNTGMKLESIPFTFLGANKTAIEPKTGMELRHPVY
ncbi:MAG: M23 family metallopeptidase [Gammaproteobacteria bacterium]|nr:M23 family metallopeptidase [Gammaproteobacteria bacterium]